MAEKARGRARLSRRGIAGIVAALALAAIGLTTVASSVAAPDPVNTVAPSVTGAAQQGQQLTSSTGTWTSGNPPIQYTYQWQRCNPDVTGCANISGATSATYTLGSADVSSVVRSVVTATDTTGAASQASAATSTVTAATSLAPANTTPPTITGTPANGQTLSAVDGQWTGATPITFSYLWQLCDSTGAGCLPITGATAKTYLLTSSAVGKTLRVQVTAANSNGTRASTSVPTAVVSSTPTTLVKLANGVTSIDASEVALPARLILSKFRVQQSQPLHTRAPFRVTFTVTDTRGYVVRNALVYLIGLPYNRIQTVPEQKTGQDGTATFTLTPTSLQPLKVGARLVIFGRARVEGDSLLAGASTRRLVEVVFGAPR